MKKISGGRAEMHDPLWMPIAIAIAALGGITLSMKSLGAAGLFIPLAASAVTLVGVLSADGTRSRIIRLLSVFLMNLGGVVIAAFLDTGSFSDAFVSLAIISLPALFPGVITFGIWLSVRRGKNRSFAIAFSAALGTVFWLIVAGINIKHITGKLDIEQIRAVLDAFFEPLRAALASVTIDYKGTGVQVYGDNEIAGMIAIAKRTFIGSLGAVMMIASYIVTLIARIFAAFSGLPSLFPSEEHDEIAFVPVEEDPDDIDILVERIRFPWRIEISTVSAAVALAAYAVRMIFGHPEKTLTMVTVAENLMILLMPGLVYVGIRAAFTSLAGKSRGMFGFRSRNGNPVFAVLLIIIAAVLFFISPSAPFMLFAANGAVDIFSENFRRAEALHYDDADDRKE